MTANRWWVRLAARWVARIDGARGHFQLAMLALTGVSTATLTLRQYGHGDLSWPLIVTLGVVGLVYAYYYTEGGVWNQVSRDKQDLSSNYSRPTMYIDDTIIGVAVFAALKGRKPDAEEREMIEAAVSEQFHEMRDGVSLD